MTDQYQDFMERNNLTPRQFAELVFQEHPEISECHYCPISEGKTMRTGIRFVKDEKGEVTEKRFHYSPGPYTKKWMFVS